jgi:hypothetical protein
MQKIICLLTTLSLTTSLNLVLGVQLAPSLAQMADESMFFEKGKPEEQTEETGMESNWQEDRDVTEEQLEQDLNIQQKDPGQSTEEEIPSPTEGLDPNVPESPDQEIEIDYK